MKHGTHIFQRSLDFVTAYYRQGCFDPCRAWDSLGIAGPRRALRRRLLRYGSAAAAVALLAGIIVWIFIPLSVSDSMTVIAAADKPVEYILPDSTRISLDPGSKLSFDPHTYAEVRHVRVAGGAMLSVTRAPGHPFSVGIDQATVTVLGTVFSVREIGTDSVNVSVTSGRVRLSSSDGQVILTQDMSGLAAPGAVRVTSGELTIELDVTDTPISKIAGILAEEYGLIISGIPDETDHRFTLSFKGTPDELAGMISTLLSVPITITAL